VVTVTDVNEAPTAVLLAPNSVAATLTVGDVIGQLTTTIPISATPTRTAWSRATATTTTPGSRSTATN
jgi:hypothetical protein